MSQSEELLFEEFTNGRVSVVLHRADAQLRHIVVMAHGFKSSKLGPSRYFVELGRSLAASGISTLRFDQPGSGDSEGSFEDSSFLTWIDAIEHFARRYSDNNIAVALLGQSVGGRAALAAATRLGDAVKGIALWSPALMLHADSAAERTGWMEEEGQRVSWDFWREVESFDFLALYRNLAVPTYCVFGTADSFISVSEMRVMESAAKKDDRIRVIEGLPHSAWPEPHRSEIIRETEKFLVGVLTS